MHRRRTASRQTKLSEERRHFGDPAFRGAALLLASGIVVIMVALVGMLLVDAWPAMTRYGLGFLTGRKWDPVFLEFGALPYIVGTLVTSALALLIAAPLAVGAAIYVAEYAPRWLRGPVSFIAELLAAIPSIVYGLWGFFALGPLMRGVVEPSLKAALSPVPLLSSLVEGPPLGRDFLIAGIILSIMIFPTIMAVSREVLMTVPDTQREAMLSLGATKWETVQRAVLPFARSGIAGAAILGLARALGETMAVTMVIGNSSSRISASLFTPGYTMASAIANQFTEADSPMYFSAIVEIALVLLLVATIVNILARILVWTTWRGPAQVRV